MAVEELKQVAGIDEVGWLGSCREVGRMLLYDMPFFLRLQGTETRKHGNTVRPSKGRVTTKSLSDQAKPELQPN